MKNILSYKLYESIALTKQLYGHNLAPYELEEIKGLDISKNFKYLPQIASYYLDGIDNDDIATAIKDFDDKCNRGLIKEKDIRKYKTFDMLQKALADSATDSGRDKRKKAKANSLVILDNKDFKIVKPDSYEASCLYGAGTKWCISSDDDTYWQEYVDKMGGEFYFVFIKNHAIAEELRDNYYMGVEEYYRSYDEDEDIEITEDDINSLENYQKISVGFIRSSNKLNVTNGFDVELKPSYEFFNITGLEKNIFN